MSGGLALTVLGVTVSTCAVASQAFAFTHIIIVDQHAVVTPLDDVAAEVQRTCATSAGFTHVVEPTLVRGASTNGDAARRSGASFRASSASIDAV